MASAERIGAAQEADPECEDEREGLLQRPRGGGVPAAGGKEGGADLVSRVLQAWRAPISAATCAPQRLKDCIVYSTLEEESLAQLRHLASVPFDGEEPLHERELRRFFAAVRSPQEARDLPTGKDPRWKELGFQAEDPRTDFRGGGFLALQNMCYLAEAFPDETSRMVREATPSSPTGGTGSAMCEYLFAAACINISAMLVLLLGLNSGPSMSPVRKMPCPAHLAARKNFARALLRAQGPRRSQDLESPDMQRGGLSAKEVFGELFSCGVMKLHAEWRALCRRKPDATLLDFGDALGCTAVALERLLGSLDAPEATVVAQADCTDMSSARVLFAALDAIDAQHWRTRCAIHLARARSTAAEIACRACAVLAEVMGACGLPRFWS